jgi:hypothetical protein
VVVRVTQGRAAARKSGRIAGLVFALVWLSCAWFGSWEWNPNNATRMFAALSLVEQGDATIDEYAALTLDKAQFGAHSYSDKAPGTTLMAMPAIAIADRVSGQVAHDISIEMWHPATERFLKMRLRLATATTAALLTALAALALFDFGRTLGGSNGVGSDAAGVFAALGYGLGTPVWGWSTTLFGHAPVAALLVIATWAIWRGTEDARPSAGHAALAGGALGWTIVVEYPAAIPGIAIGLWALWRLRRWPLAESRNAILAAVAAGVVALIPLIAYNLLAFGTLFRLGYQGVVGFDGMKEGLFGLTYPKPWVLWEIVAGGKRGMIWVAPIALAGAAGLVAVIRDRSTRDLGILAASIVVLMFLYNAAYVYWDGGNSTGPRHAVPALGFLALGLPAIWRVARDVWAKAALVALLGASIGINLAIASAEIASGGKGDFPLWEDVVLHRFVEGELRTFPSEWSNWSTWQGLGLWAVLAGLVLAAILLLLRQEIDSTG